MFGVPDDAWQKIVSDFREVESQSDGKQQVLFPEHFGDSEVVSNRTEKIHLEKLADREDEKETHPWAGVGKDGLKKLRKALKGGK